MKIRIFGAILASSLLILASWAQAETPWPRMTASADGTPISYEVHGSGEPTLVFVHGWSCDGRYWREQVSRFAGHYRVVTVDLAGHGHSGLDRERYSIEAFGHDVRAVIEALEAEAVVLIGHSMGGPVIAQAARGRPDRVLGLIGVDTFQNVGATLSAEEIEQWMAPLRADFRANAKGFVTGMFRPEADPSLRDWVVADMTAAPAAVALGAMQSMLEDMRSGTAAEVFDGLDLPVIAINADLWPTEIEGNRQHIGDFEAIILENTDHFLMMNEPSRFNEKLAAVIHRLANPETATD